MKRIAFTDSSSNGPEWKRSGPEKHWDRLIQNDNALQGIKGGVLNCHQRISISISRRPLSYQEACHPSVAGHCPERRPCF